jgi:putative heme-binding domain-containing protein
MKRTVLGLALLLAAPAWGQNLEAGRKAYFSFCANCHGAEGMGARGPALNQPLTRGQDDQGLIRIILGGIPGSEMPPTRVFEQELRDLVAYVRSMAKETAAGIVGNPENGKDLYLEKGCAQCHAIDGDGGRMGPDLSRIGRSRSASYLTRALTNPAAEVPERFAQYRLIIPMPDNFLLVHAEPREGPAITGVRLNEDPFTIQIRDFSDRIHSFNKADLKNLRKDYGQSPMPSYDDMPEPEIDDLVGYLLTLRGEQ